MSWRVAYSLKTLIDQVNKIAPFRSKESDGTIGDAAHAVKSSDHNPWVKDGKMGVVTGIDITNDTNHGVASHQLALALVASRDLRIKYIISNAQIISGFGGPKPWVWRKYSGSEHRKHVHISVKSDKASYDSIAPWNLEALSMLIASPLPAFAPPMIGWRRPWSSGLSGIRKL